MQELLDLVRANRIDCIMVKDFSRFGRNSLETGYFIERVFPLFHTRFISVHDDFDTQKLKGDTGGMEVAFKYLISEYYSRDMSVKTKTAKYLKFQRGEYQSKICPYGYRKGENGRMVPDPETSEVVQKIFEYAVNGMNAADIARELSRQQIPTPGEHKVRKGIKTHDVSRTHGMWCNSTVLRILADERYMGTYVIGKREVTEIGGHKMRSKAESDWIKIPNHHIPLVNEEIFSKANASIQRFKIPNRKKHNYLLRGKVICGCCKHALHLANGTSYRCRFSSTIPSLDCYNIQIREKELNQLVYELLCKQFQVVKAGPSSWGRGSSSSSNVEASPRTIPRAAPKSWPFSSARMRSRRCSSSSSSFSITAAASTTPRRPRPRRAAAPGETVGEAAATGAPSAAESPPARSSRRRTLRTAWK